MEIAKQPSNPISVLIADVHYDLSTLELADKSVRMAINKANELNVPLIVAGDLHNSKANLRGECVKAMIETFFTADTPPYVLIGNHCRINERDIAHSLEFLHPYAMIVQTPVTHRVNGTSLRLIPYHHDAEELRLFLKDVPEGSTLIMHQGIVGSVMGDYIQDKSAIEKQDIANFRVISGHYHCRQDIQCGRPRKGAVGLASYVGNPYTLSFGEAWDPAKGFQILMDDGSLEFVPTNLRKHVKIELYTDELVAAEKYGRDLGINPGDLVLVRVSGTREALASVDKDRVAKSLGIEVPFRLELLPEKEEPAFNHDFPNQPQESTLDSIIDALTNCSEDQKNRLKKLWRDLL